MGGICGLGHLYVFFLIYIYIYIYIYICMLSLTFYLTFWNCHSLLVNSFNIKDYSNKIPFLIYYITCTVYSAIVIPFQDFSVNFFFEFIFPQVKVDRVGTLYYMSHQIKQTWFAFYFRNAHFSSNMPQTLKYSSPLPLMLQGTLHVLSLTLILQWFPPILSAAISIGLHLFIINITVNIKAIFIILFYA